MTKDENVTNFLGGLIELTGMNRVDGDSNKYIRVVSSSDTDGSIESIRTSEGERKLAIYGSTATDAAIVNPFVEGNSDSALDNWFYGSQNCQVSALIILLMTKILESAARTRGKNGKKNEEPTDKFCAPYIGRHAIGITQKSVDEFKSLSESSRTFFSIFYKSRERVGKINCSLFSPSNKTDHPNIRVNSWEVFQDIFLRLLGIKNINDLDYKPDSPNVPVLESFVSILIRIYDQLKGPMENILGRKINGIDALKEHMKHLDEYYQTAKWCASSTVTTTEITAPAAVSGTLPPAVQANLGPQPVTASDTAGLPPAVAANMMASSPVQCQAAPTPVSVSDAGLPPTVQANLAALRNGF